MRGGRITSFKIAPEPFLVFGVKCSDVAHTRSRASRSSTFTARRGEEMRRRKMTFHQ